MGTTTSLQSVGLWHLQTQASQALLEGRGFFSPGRRKLSLYRYLQNPYDFKKPPVPAYVFKKCGRVIVNSSSTSIATTTTAVSSDEDETVLDVGEIKHKYCKWQWRGQYFINYFVYSDADSPINPPLLLVHGFGASIHHWRR